MSDYVTGVEVPEDFPIKTEVKSSATYKGIPCVTALAPINGASNGYIRLPSGHPWLEVDYIENSVPWGEITFKRGNWIGFDTMHSGQYWPGSPYSRYADDCVMDHDMVTDWALDLAMEAHEATTGGTYQI